MDNKRTLKIFTVDIPQELEVLRQISKPVTLEQLASTELQNLIDEMVTLVKTEKRTGGIAAIQLGHPYRIFISEVLDDDFKQVGEPIIFINPEVQFLDFTKVLDYEGCLSIPKRFGQVFRYNKIRIKYLDREGNEHKDKFEDYTARIMQHEYDHLDGILFTDKLAPGTVLKNDSEI